MTRRKSSKDNKLEYKFQGTGLTKSEKRWAKKRFEEYVNKYHRDSYSDLQLIEELVFREALQERYKAKIGVLSEKDDKKKTSTEKIPTYLLKGLDENLTQILTIKEKLGLLKDETNTEDPFKYIQTLKEKFKKWKQENQASRNVKCPHCQQMVLLRIKTDCWEAQKHPFFKDRIFGSDKLWKLYKEGKITKKDVAEVLKCSTDYVDWLEFEIYSKNK